MLGFTSIYQVPMVGSDGKHLDCALLGVNRPSVCGFIGNATENLCARWAMLGAFSPFYRNHNDIGGSPQEFYRWPVVTRAAKAAIEIRYKLMDYLYTAFHGAHVGGTPVVQPLWFVYPNDKQTFGIEHQFFFGDGIMVCPVLDEGKEVEIYLPDDIYYEFGTKRPVRGPEAKVWVRQVELDEIPLLIRGGTIIPMRSESAMTTKELRNKDFEILVAPGLLGTAIGSLYMDDGVSLEQENTLDISYAFDGERLSVVSSGNFDAGVQYSKITIVGVDEAPTVLKFTLAGGKILQAKDIKWDAENEVISLSISLPLNESFTVDLIWEQSTVETGKEQVPLHDEL
jgi:alpha-glucosidase